jgi:hypothetical protein
MVRKAKVTKNKAAISATGPRTSISKRESSAKAKSRNSDSSLTALEEELSPSISIQEKVALLAYSYWEKRGRQGGFPEDDWYRAEKEVLDQLGLSNR